MDPVPVSDTAIILFFGTIALACAYLFERLVVLSKIAKATSRKLLELVAIGACAIVAGLVENVMFLALLVFMVGGILFYLIYFKSFLSENGAPNLGFVYFPLVFLVLLLLFPDKRFLIIAPMGLLVVGSSTVFGFNFFFAHMQKQASPQRIGVIESLLFVAASTCWLLFLGLLYPAYSRSWNNYFMLSLSIAIVCALIEPLGRNWRNHIWLPFTAVFILWGSYNAPSLISAPILFASVFAGICGAYVVYKYKLLTWQGAITAALIGISIIAFGGFSIFPLAIFFISSALLERIPTRDSVHEEDRLPRSNKQVFANGGLTILLADCNLIFPNPKWEILYLVVCAVAIADTWSTIIGTRFGRKPVDLWTLKKIPVGVSGGVTWAGIIGAVAGATIIALFAPDNKTFAVVVLFGLSGSLLDSLFGSVLQARYISTGGSLTDEKTEYLASGIHWMSNNLVNFSSIALITALAFLMF